MRPSRGHRSLRASPRSQTGRSARRRSIFGRLGLVASVAGLTLTACASGASAATGSSKGADPKPASACGLAAFSTARKPVTVNFWHAFVSSNNTWLVSTINQFNSSQDKVHVNLLQFPSYQALFTKYLAGLSTGDVPDVGEFEETTVQQLVDSNSMLPVQTCINASHYALTDYVKRALSYYSYRGVQESMPWAVSNVVLFFNVDDFRKAGLDPTKPPTTLQQVQQDAQRIVASGAATHGIALPEQPYDLEHLLAKSGGQLVNNGNGRSARATRADLTSSTSLKIWTWWNHMVTSGLAINTGPNPNGIDHLLALGTGAAAMTFEASSAIGPIEAVLNSGQYKGVSVAAAPLPGLTTGGGVPVGDGSLWISAKSPPATRAAAWELIQFLDSPAEQASMAAACGYAPVRTSATKVPVLVAKWSADPSFRVAYEQLTSGAVNNANLGSLIGDYQGVRNAIRDGMVQMLSSHLSPSAAAQYAEQEANMAIDTYNERVGAG